MEENGYNVTILHGAKDDQERDALVDGVRNGTSKLLITTNALASDMDFSTTSMGINYDTPRKGMGDCEPDLETYFHRIGYIGGSGRVGPSISFVHDHRSYEAVCCIANLYTMDFVQLDPSRWDDSERKTREMVQVSRAAQSWMMG